MNVVMNAINLSVTSTSVSVFRASEYRDFRIVGRIQTSLYVIHIVKTAFDFKDAALTVVYMQSNGKL